MAVRFVLKLQSRSDPRDKTVHELQNPVWLSECWWNKVEPGSQEKLSPLSE